MRAAAIFVGIVDTASVSEGEMMYTQVTFGEFLNNVLERSGLEFEEYPNTAIQWNQGDWGYEILNDMSVRIFRYAVRDRETKIDRLRWSDTQETPELFQPRFESAFKAAIANLQPPIS